MMMMMMMIQIAVIIEVYDLIRKHTIFYPSYNKFCFRKILHEEWEFNAAVNQLFIHFKKAYGSLTRELFSNIII
jgi:hypothetical protein